MTIRIKQLTFEAIIGILEHERQKPQRVVVDIEIEYSYSTGELINYAVVSKEVEAMMIKNRFELLEDALITIEEHLTKQYQKLLKTLTIEIEKPDIMNNCTVSLSKSKRF
ncbi:MAG: dihydroneopterin aldolase [Campylobacterales bacterium]|nr:dihydroneopterin aldolase [Campylobacterales bacterium]